MSTALRSNCVREICHNFKKIFKGCLACPMKCNTTNPQDDTLTHLLSCKKISAGSTVHLDKIYGVVVEQQQVARVFLKLIKRRKLMLQDSNSSLRVA